MVHRQKALVDIAARKKVHLDMEKAAELIESSWQEHVSAWRRGHPFGAPSAARWLLGRLDPRSDPGEPIDDELADELAEAIEGATSEVGTRVVEGAGEAVAAVRAAGIRTALVCDTGFTPGRYVRQFLDEHGIELDYYFFSDEIGMPKPFPPIFQAALKATGAAPADAVHIGDLRRTDIAGAHRAGMAAIRFAGVHDDAWSPEDSSGAEADAVLRNWADLTSLLGI